MGAFDWRLTPEKRRQRPITTRQPTQQQCNNNSTAATTTTGINQLNRPFPGFLKLPRHFPIFQEIVTKQIHSAAKSKYFNTNAQRPFFFSGGKTKERRSASETNEEAGPIY